MTIINNNTLKLQIIVKPPRGLKTEKNCSFKDQG